MMLLPILAICCWMRYFAPEPIAAVAITAATPITLPNMVSVERSLFTCNARNVMLGIPCQSHRPPFSSHLLCSSASALILSVHAPQIISFEGPLQTMHVAFFLARAAKAETRFSFLSGRVRSSAVSSEATNLLVSSFLGSL